ncbi:titin [Bactrocera neohumeralis]|uniref:titin n=1 Tax=Bactrocera neohumeralis TaxID=98809 RepID=UPI00216675F0|nr:titin [Bactrocera neohumeralis]
MSALARFIVGVTSSIAPRDKVSTISSKRGFSNSNITVNTSNCYSTSADTACNTELNGPIRRCRSSKLKIDTERGKSSCSPALLEFSFDSGIGMGSSSFTGNVSVVDEKLTSKTENIETLKSGTDILGTDSVSGNDAVDFHDKLANFVSIDNGIIKYSTEEISWKLRYERLQQCRLILFALDRQQTQYRQLRERLSKIGEGRIAKKEPVIDNICNVCSCPINIIDSKSFITCFVCNKRICHATKCSNFVPKSGRRECQICHLSKNSLTHTQSWITEQMFFSRQNHSYPVRARSEIYIPIKDYNEGSINFESVSQVGASSFAITADQKTKIREYVEEVVAKLLGNSLDQIRVTQLSKSENHLPGILNNHVIHPHPVGLNDNQTKENILTEFSEISQARLRNMVESIIAEMLGTSRLTNVNVSEPELNTNTYGNGHSQLSHRHRTEHPFEPKAYQDFLAKAVLNKIADNEGYIRKLSESTPDLSSCNIDINFNMDDRSNSPESSLETSSPFNYADAQHSSKIIKDLDRESTINDYIASYTVPLPDLSAAMTDYEDDDMASVSSSILVEGNWEDNWLFRKKGPSLTTSITGSVGMLVPAPKDDVRAQIGDKTTDEISDLSEIDSDTDDSVQICAGLDPYNDRIINKHLIGGQNTKVILDELIETASLISNTSHSPNEANYIDTRNDHIVEKSFKTEAFNSKVANHSPLELKISSKSMPTNCYEAHTAHEPENNPISAPFQATESIEVDESCTGFSSVEIFEEPVLSHDTRSICQGTSVIEILAAITLAPLLAVPASEQPSIQAPFEMNTIKELSDLALAEIKLRIPELSHHSLDIIDEEEESKVINSLEIDESCSEKCVPLSDIKENTNSPLIPNAITNLADENDLHDLPNKICAETHSPDIVLLPSSLERTSFEGSNRSNITQLPELKTYSIEEPSNVILLHSEAETQLSSKPIIRCSSHEEPSETIYPLEKEIPKICTEAVIGDVKYTKGILSSETTQTFEFEKQVHYNETRDEPKSQTPEDNSIDTEAVKLIESENEKTSNEPKIECIINAKSTNENQYTDERNNEAETKESSGTPYTSAPQKQESISESDGECILVTEAEESSVTDNGTKNRCTEPEVETVMDIECENPSPFTDQVEKCAIEKEVSESLQTSHTLATEKQQSVYQLPGDKKIDTEVVELSEIEKQIARNEPEVECAKDAQNENETSYIDHKNEHNNEVETQESSETPYTPLKEKQETISESTGVCSMDTQTVECSVTDSGTQNPCTESEVETVIGTECENPTPFTHQVEKCAIEKEVSESSQTSYILATEKQQSACELPGDKNVDTEAVELSEREKQVECNEPEIECAKDAQSENEIAHIDHKNEHDNEAETEESSETPDSPIPETQVLISESTGECIMDTQAVECSVTDNGTQNPCTEPEVETVMYELPGDKNMDTEAVELSESEKQIAFNEPEIDSSKDAQSEIEMSYIDHKNEHDNEAETEESSETPCTLIPEKQEPISESTGECIMDTQTVEFSVTDNGTQNPCSEKEETVMGTECENPTPFTHQVEKCVIEKEVSESSQTSYISATDKQQSVCELPGEKNMDTEVVEFSEREKQVASNKPETECAKDAQSEDEISHVDHKNEHDNDVENEESSETPDTPIPETQVLISESTGECVMDTQTVEFSVTDNGIQNPCTEPEVETVLGTECKNPTPFTHHVEKCVIEKEISESSQTSYILATDKQQSVCELPGEKNMDTEAVELSEREKQVASNKPETDCSKDAQSEIEMSYIEHKNEHDNEEETEDSSETPYTPIPENQEPISESTGECIMDTQTVEFPVTDNGTQNPCTEPKVETVLGTECENPTPFTHQVEKCVIEKEVSESSQTSYILATEKQQSVCELPGDKNMDTEVVELSEREKQVASNKPEIKCAKDAQSEDEISHVDHKNEHDNDVENEESSETPDTPIPEAEEPISESTGECIMDTQAVEFSVADNGTQNLCTEPELETVMGKECENPTPFTHHVEKCTIEKEVSESSQTSYILATEKQQSVCELPGDKNMDNEPEIECAKDVQSENEISHIDHKNEHDNEAENEESSETPDTPIPEAEEPISESTGECIMDTQTVEFSVTDNGTQNPCTEPEVETVLGTECENPTPFTHQVEKCVIEKEVSESSQTSYILATEKQQSVCELPGDKNMDTEVVEFSESEKQVASNEPEIECVKDAQSENEISHVDHKNEHDNDVENEESSKTRDTPIPETQVLISESTGECVMDTQTVEFSVTDNGTQNPCTESEVETVIGTECENPTPFTHHVEKCTIEKEVSESSQTSYILATEKQQSVCKLPGDKNVDTEAEELSEREKQVECNEPEIECAKDAQSENEISHVDHKNEHDNEVETEESSETPDTLIPDKQKPISELTGECIRNAQTVEFSVKGNGKQNPCTEPEVETVKVTECENSSPFKYQKEKCSTEKKVIESYTFATDKQEAVCDSPGDKIMDTESVELTEIEKLKPKGECAIDAQREIEIPYIEQKDERGNEAETQESSETPYIPLPQKQEIISESKEDKITETAAVEFFKLESVKQKPCNEPGKEVRTLFNGRKEECTNGTETHKSSDPLCISAVDMQENSSGPNGDNVINTGCEFRMPFRGQKEESANDNHISVSKEGGVRDTLEDNKTEDQEFSKSSYSCEHKKNESSSDVKDAEVVELYASESEKQKPRKILEGRDITARISEKEEQKSDSEIIKEYGHNMESARLPPQQGNPPCETKKFSYADVLESSETLQSYESSIAEREYKKWNNAVEMPNNPYTPDALKRRICGSQERFIDLPNISSSTNKSVITVKAEDDGENESTSNIGYKRYSRDYYINADNPPKVSPNHQNHRNDKRKRLSSGCSDELIEDTFTKESISQGNEIIAKETPVVIHPTVYLALPAQVVEESASFETLSNQSMNSVNTTTSDDSDTIRIYDFKKQTTVIVHNDDKPSTTDITMTTSDSVEPFPATTECALTKDALAKSKKIDEYKELYPREILLEAKPAETCVSTLAPGPTPKAFKFLQPKRRLIDPSQVLPLEEEAHGLSVGEKAVVEEEVAQVMPSVKALAQAFLLSSNKCSQAEKRWKKGIQKRPSTAVKLNNPPTAQTENMVTAPEMTEDATIASDLSSLETDPSANMDILTNKTKTSSPERTAYYEDNNNKSTTNMLRRVSMLKSNIAFFENLKFK